MYSVNRTPRMDVETEPIHFTQDDHHSIQERPTHDAPIGSRTPAATGEDEPRVESLSHLFSDPSPYGAQLGP